MALARDRERLFALERGGAPERPIEVPAASVVEVSARAVECPRCNGRHHLEEHLAVTISGNRLREARLLCRECGTRRSLWFHVAELN